MVALLGVVVEELQLDALGGAGEEGGDAVVEGGELGVAVDGVRLVAIGEDADAPNDSLALVADDDDALERGVAVEELLRELPRAGAGRLSSASNPTRSTGTGPPRAGS